MKSILLSLLILLSGLFASAQQTLSMEEFLTIVRRYHPIAKQAELGVEIAKAEIISARGAFDPQFENSINRKKLDGLLYYNHQLSEVKVPVWFGVDVVAGMESLSGERTATPETKGNSSYIGFRLPVAKGLLMDSRRATLQQAKIFQQLSEQEQQAMINDLLHDATKAYLMWWQQYQLQQLFQQAKQNAAQRFWLVKKAFEIGERPAIDTAEALVQWQSFQMRANEIMLAVTNAQLEVDGFLWQQNGALYALPQTAVPQAAATSLLEPLQLQNLLQQVQVHPELQQYQFKLKALAVEKQLKFQSLLPSVYLKYNQLTKSHDPQKLFSTPWLENNYRYGVAVSIPLRFSEGRGEYRKTKLKMEQIKWQQWHKQINLQNKIRQYYNEWKQLQEQLALQQQVIQNYTALQRGEEIRFTNGESSLFLITAREQKTLEAQQKLIELQSKYQKAAFDALWIAGKLTDY